MGGMEQEEGPRLMTPAEVAHFFRVDSKTLARWVKAGKLRAVWTPGGHRRYYETEVLALPDRKGGRDDSSG